MVQRMIAPGKYVRCEGVTAQTGKYCSGFCKRAYIMGGKTALSVAQDNLVNSLKREGIEVAAVDWYGGESSWSNIKSGAERASALGADVIIGVGGGKALDTAKAAAFLAGLPVITVPTIAATCAAWTPLSAIYDDKGVYETLTDKAQNPSLVLVDTEIIVNAPVNFLRAGIGDTLAKWFELEITSRKAKNSVPVAAALNIANLCYKTLLEYGEEAIEAVKNKTVKPQLEQIIDTNIMLSGMVSGLGGDECRTAAAHAIYSGLTCLDEVHKCLHGEIVAYGVLSQLILDGREKEVEELISYYQKTELPYTLKQLGIIDFTDEKARSVGIASVEIEDMNNMPFEVNWQMVVIAILKVDKIGRKVIQQCQ